MAGNDDGSFVRRTGAADTDLVITDVSVATHSVPTSTPSEQDATMEWDATTIVVVTVTAGAWQGLGFTYGPTAVAVLVADDLAEVIEGRSAIDVRARWLDLYTATRNLGRPGVASLDVVWHEEPVSSNDLAGLRRVRESTPPGMAVAAGEYCWDAFDARDLVMADAVDCLQADVTRCGGFTGSFDIASLCWAHEVDLSAHCAPNLSMHPCVAVPRVRHVEYFHDHVRIERGLFDGTVEVVDGQLRPDRDRPGHGLSLRPGALDTASRTT